MGAAVDGPPHEEVGADVGQLEDTAACDEPGARIELLRRDSGVAPHETAPVRGDNLQLRVTVEKTIVDHARKRERCIERKTDRRGERRRGHSPHR